MTSKQQKNQKDNMKIRQFEWYEVETKVREIMGELLQPFNKKQTEDTIKINQIKRIQANIQKKLEDHDFLFQRQNAHKPTYIQLQDDKITQLSQKITKNYIENQSRIKRMEAVIAVYQEKINQLNELQRRLDKQVLQRAEEFHKYKESLDKQITLMVKRQDTQIQEINQFKNTTKSAVNKMETRMITFDNRLKELQDQHKHRSSDIKKLLQDSVITNEKLIKSDMKISNLLTRVEDREKDSKLSQKFFAKVKEVEGELKFLTNFLQQYQPLYIQMQISQTLNSFVQGKQRRKLCIYQQQTFAKLHHHILLNEKITLQDMMSTYSGGIRKIINRNKKYVINLAVAETVKCGNNVYQFRIENVADNEDEEDTKKKVVASVNPEQIAKVVDQHLENVRSELKKIVNDQLVPTRTWMSQLQEQLLIRSLQYDKKYQQTKKCTIQVVARQQLQQKHVRSQINLLNEQQQQLNTFINNFKDYIRDILNFSSVINHIVIQDEIDRQGTALYALRSDKNEGMTPPTIQLDQNCLNCDGKTAGIIQKAFKMACLTYNPSQIRIDDQMFSREEILEISTGILQKLKKRLFNGETVKSPPQDFFLKRSSGTSSKNQTKRKSLSTIKDTPSGNQTARVRDLQTLLPTLGASKQQKQRKTQLSVFY